MKTTVPIVIVCGLAVCGGVWSMKAGNAVVAPRAPAGTMPAIAPTAPGSPPSTAAPVAPTAPVGSASVAPVAPIAPGANAATAASVGNAPLGQNINTGNTNAVYGMTNRPYGNAADGYTNNLSPTNNPPPPDY